MNDSDRETFEELERRLRALLPEEYQDRYEDLDPVPMGSAGVRYGADGRIAWDQMWGGFCDLAIAGGPPHKGTLLSPGTAAAIETNPDRYAAIVAEICRGIGMVTTLPAAASSAPGWVRVECLTRGMAGWLLRAISMENVAVRADGVDLELPAGPDYHELKEVKNVITVIAKTAHYWLGHMPIVQRQAIASLIEGMNEESPLIVPVYPDGGAAPDVAALSLHVGDRIEKETGLQRAPGDAGPWLGIECASVRAAVWMMRMLVTVNVLSRREGTVLFLPVNPDVDPDGEVVASSLELVHRLAAAKAPADRRRSEA
jgi:hypothetical protein